MLKRRDFIVMGSILGLSTCVDAKMQSSFVKGFREVESLISVVQQHMFPPNASLPSARESDATAFLFETLNHPSYDKDIRAFIIEGAKELMGQEKQSLLRMSSEEIEKTLRRYEETSYGSAWLSCIMTLTIEGMFSDPIYKANKKEIGWIKLKAYGGYPRPTTRYLENV